MKYKDTSFNLFDIIEQEEAKDNPGACEHRRMHPTVTLWNGDPDKRLTMTCIVCGHIRGRFPDEWGMREA